MPSPEGEFTHAALHDAPTGLSAWRLAHRALDGVVDTWWCRLAPFAGDLARVSTWLSAGESARAGRFGTPALRERYMIGRGTLRMVLSNALGMPPGQVPI